MHGCCCCRLLDDNRQLFVPELQETINPHPHFMLFATQNPPGEPPSSPFITPTWSLDVHLSNAHQLTGWHREPRAAHSAQMTVCCQQGVSPLFYNKMICFSVCCFQPGTAPLKSHSVMPLHSWVSCQANRTAGSIGFRAKGLECPCCDA